MDKTIEQLSREIDAAMKREDFGTAAELTRTILMHPVSEVGMDAFKRASVIFAYALLKLGNKDEAKNVLLSLRKSGIGLVDACFLLFCIAFDDRNIEEVIEYGKGFLEQIYDGDAPPESVTTAAQNAHEVINNLATTLLERGRVGEAVDVLVKGIEHKKDYPLLYVNLGIAYFKLDNFEDAEKALLEGTRECEDNGEISRTLGLIYLERDYYIRAEIHLRNAVEKEVYEAHMDLGILYNKLSKIYDAEEELQNYLKHNPGESTATKMLYDVRSLEYFGRPEEKVSAAMIVKNEENMLEECIESFREAVDEIVIVDTGSTDRTVEIAEKYNVELYHHKWKNDFSEARNFSISKTSGDWVLIIDADERLERKDIAKVRALKWSAKYDVMCFGVYSVLPGNIGNAN